MFVQEITRPCLQAAGKDPGEGGAEPSHWALTCPKHFTEFTPLTCEVDYSNTHLVQKGNWGTEGLHNFPKLIHLEVTKIHTQAVWLQDLT